MQASELFTLPDTHPFLKRFQPEASPWEWVRAIRDALSKNDFQPVAKTIPPGVHCEGDVFIHPTVKLPHTCTLIGPCYIGAGTELRPGAYLRGNVIAGENCVLGNACEFKNCLLLDDVEVPHFSYVGDSILGNGVHLGAGVILSNLRLDRAQVTVRLAGDRHMETGMRKLGAMLGDGAEIGCNAVLQPGTVVGKRALIAPAIAFGGYLEAGVIARVRTSEARTPRRD